MTGIEDLKHLWKYEISLLEKSLLGIMVVGMFGLLVTQEEAFALAGFGSFILLNAVLIIRHN